MTSPERMTQQYIKFMHLKEIYLRVLHGEGISRAQLKQDMNLSFPSVSALVEELICGGVLEEAGMQGSTKRGRPGILLKINPHALSVPVVAMTPDGYRYCIYDAAATVLEEGFLPYIKPAQLSDLWKPDAESICAPLVKLLAGLRLKHTLQDLVLSVPGSINARGELTSSALRIKLPPDFIEYLQKTVGLTVCLINDSDAEAYTERLLQPLFEDFVFIHVGKGVGAGIIRKGKIFDSDTMRAGEIGHITIDYRGKPCSCGNRGCLERYINMDAFCQDAAVVFGRPVQDFAEVCLAYKQGNPQITEMVDQKAELLAVGISNMIAIQPVTYVVLGGGIEQLGQKFLEKVRCAVQTVGFRKYMNRISVTYTVNTSGSGARGALWDYLYHKMKIERILKQPEEA